MGFEAGALLRICYKSCEHGGLAWRAILGADTTYKEHALFQTGHVQNINKCNLFKNNRLSRVAPNIEELFQNIPTENEFMFTIISRRYFL